MADQGSTSTFARSLYWIGIPLCLFPLADMVGRLLPMHPGNVQWRFGALGLVFGGTLVMMVLGLALVAFVAASRRHSAVLLVVAVVALAIAVCVVTGLVVFGLDAVQLRSSIQQELRPSMTTAAVSAALSALLTVVALIGLATACFRTRRDLRSDMRATERTPAIVVS